MPRKSAFYSNLRKKLNLTRSSVKLTQLFLIKRRNEFNIILRESQEYHNERMVLHKGKNLM